jgi:hypothetical protein
MKSGNSSKDEAFSDSLAEAIENAFKIEWSNIKGESLSDNGSDDRRLLFAAIAQGILSYLKDHENDFLVYLKDSKTTAINIQSPHLDLTPKEGGLGVVARGTFFAPNRKVTIIWDNPLQEYSFKAKNDGTFVGEFELPTEVSNGKHLVEARDGAGHVALAAYTKS